MASHSTRVGRGIGSALGLFLGIREGDRRRKKRFAAKADLDEKQLQEARDKELRAARLKIFLGGDLAPEQEQQFLTTQGFGPTVSQKLSREASGLGLTTLSPEEEQISGEFQAEQRGKAEEIRRRQQLGLTKQPLAGLIAGGSVKEPGFERAPSDIATQSETEAKTELLQQELVTEIQRGEAQKQLAAKRKRVESAIASGKKSEQMSALRTLQGGLLARIKSLDRIIEADPFEFSPEIKKERDDLITELLGVTKELRKIGDVKETKKQPKKSKQLKESDFIKMSVDEIFKVLTEK